MVDGALWSLQRDVKQVLAISFSTLYGNSGSEVSVVSRGNGLLHKVSYFNCNQKKLNPFL